MTCPQMSSRWTFEGVPGLLFDYAGHFKRTTAVPVTTLPDLGIINATYVLNDREMFAGPSKGDLKPWKKLQAYIKHMNGQKPGQIVYKVLYITRHGLSFHNVFEAQVGRVAWNEHWSHLDGDGTVVWADARLTEAGINQVQELGNLWASAVATEQVPLPESIFTSPLARTLETTQHVFGLVFQQQERPFKPIVKELLRERLTDHTCDRRSPRSWIAEHFPHFTIEPNFTEQDILYTGRTWETQEEHDARKYRLLEDIFSNDDNDFIALVTHSYAISSLLNVIQMEHFRVKEGSSIAVVVKGQRIVT